MYTLNVLKLSRSSWKFAQSCCSRSGCVWSAPCDKHLTPPKRVFGLDIRRERRAAAFKDCLRGWLDMAARCRIGQTPWRLSVEVSAYLSAVNRFSSFSRPRELPSTHHLLVFSSSLSRSFFSTQKWRKYTTAPSALISVPPTRELD